MDHSNSLKILQKQHDQYRDAALERINRLRTSLNRIESLLIRDNTTVNELGELQADTTILDCTISNIGALRRAMMALVAEQDQ